MISSIARNWLTPANVFGFTQLSFAVLLVWFGAMNFTAVGEGIVAGWLGGHALLGGFAGNAGNFAKALGGYQIIAGVLILAPSGLLKYRRAGFQMAALYAALALSLLATNPVWIDSLGGFPAIGSGQGIIKYLAVLGLALWAASYGANRAIFRVSSTDLSMHGHIMVAGLILVLVWIGGMKFTLPEAQGIDPLLKSSPFFSWMPKILSMQMASNVIGVVELVTAALLAGWWFNRKLFLFGAILAAGTFVLTLSFLVTFPGWDADLGGFPALSRSGHFLLKGLLLLACCAVLAAHNGEAND